ncbi:MAG: hypothetical protein ACK43M_14395 [Allorhizobium sp.]
MTIKYILRSLIGLAFAVFSVTIYPVVASAMDAMPMSPTVATLDIEHAVRISDPTRFIEIGLLKPVYEESYRTAGHSLADPTVFV